MIKIKNKLLVAVTLGMTLSPLIHAEENENNGVDYYQNVQGQYDNRSYYQNKDFEEYEEHEDIRAGRILENPFKNGYIIAFVGLSDIGDSDSALFSSFTYGKDLSAIHENLGGEIVVSKSIDDGETKSGSKVSYESVGVYGTYSYNIFEILGIDTKFGIDGFAKVGATYVNTEISDVSNKDWEIGYGVGFNYNLYDFTGTEDFALRFEWTNSGFNEIKGGFIYTF